MRLTILLLLISVCSFGQVLKQPSGLMWYYEYRDPNLPDAPIVIFLHGSGEKSNTPNLSLIQKQGLPKLLKAAGMSYLPGFTVICPQQVTGRWGYNPEIIKFLQYIKANYKSEYRLLTGLSMGGDGTWDGSYQNDEKLITAMVPVSCKGDYNLAKKTAAKKIAVWGIHGDKDTGVPPSDGLRPINGMISVGANPAPVWTIIKGGTHSGSTWDVAYSLTDRSELGGTTIYKWFKSLIPTEPEPPQPEEKDLMDSIYTNSSDSIIFIFKSGKKLKR